VRASERTFDAAFVRRFAAYTGAVPLALLVYDAQAGRLGVNEVSYALHTTGLLGLIYLTLSLAVTPLRRLTGWNPLNAARRIFGLLGFGYIAIHFAIYLIWDRDGSLRSTFSEIAARTYLLVGFAALVLMIPLAITSTDAMVRRVGGKRWRLLHRLNYVIVPLGVLHFLLLVKADTTRPTQFAIVVGALLAFRAAGWLRKRIPAKVEDGRGARAR
jgi:sulfoxide reductase heme-binding subunit YedZ